MVDHELNELKREFLVEAGDKLDEMQSALEHITAESLDRLAYLAHQLKGSGGSYGYPRISDDATELEKAVESLVEKKGQGNGVDAKLQQYVVNLRSEIDRCVRELDAA